MRDQFLKQLADKIIASFSEADRWTYEKSISVESFSDKSGISFLRSYAPSEKGEMESFCLRHGENRRLQLPIELGKMMWSEAMKIKPHENRSEKDVVWFIERFDNKN